jgi:hypothetical protein
MSGIRQIGDAPLHRRRPTRAARFLRPKPAERPFRSRGIASVVMPAKAGSIGERIPAFAGMTE